MPWPTCKEGYDRRKLTPFAGGVVADLAGLGYLLNPPGASPYYVPPYLLEFAGGQVLQPNLLWAYPYPVLVPITASGAGVWLDLPEPVDVGLALYSSTGDGYPYRLLRGLTLHPETGGHLYGEWDPLDLDPGLYWVGAVCFTQTDHPPSLGVFERLLLLREFEPMNDRPAQNYVASLTEPSLPDPFPLLVDRDNSPSVGVFLRAVGR
jgi:hypothetical protein